MKENFTVECNVCKQWLENWVGSTPCCGSVAYEVNKETGEVKDRFYLYALDDSAKKIKNRKMIGRILKEGVIDFEFLKKRGLTKDKEEGSWHEITTSIEYNYYSEWMWFGKEGLPRVDSQKRFLESLNTNGDKEKIKQLNTNYTLEK